jgi:hypothetical protein
LRESAHGWRCLLCKVSSSSWSAVAGRRCAKSAADRWALAAAADDPDGANSGRPHTRWLSDDTTWCSTCGQYSTEAVVGLKRACHPIRAGTRHTRRLLASGFHPGTRMPFVNTAVPEHAWQAPEDIQRYALAAPDLRRIVRPRGNVALAKRRVAQQRARTSASAAAAASVTPPPRLVPSCLCNSATARFEAMLARVRRREADAAPCGEPASTRRRLNYKQPQP